MGQDGYAFAVKLGGTSVTGRVTSSVGMTWDMLDATTDDSAQSKEYIAGEEGWTVTVEGKFTIGDDYSVVQLHTAANTRTAVAMIAGHLTNGALRFSGNVLVNNLDVNAPKNEVVTWTATLQGTGALTVGLYTTTA